MERAAALLVKHRYIVLTVTAVILWAYALANFTGSDWPIFLGAGKAFTGSGSHGGLHVYGVQPALQMGPLALLASLPVQFVGPDQGWAIASAICMALGVLVIALVERSALALGVNRNRLAPAILVGGIFFLKAWTAPSVGWGHPDDALALTAVAASVLFVSRGRWLAAALAVGLGGAAKPWVLLALPLVLVVSNRRWRSLCVALIAALLPWVPFLIAYPHTLNVTTFHASISGTSDLRYLGVRVGGTPSWARTAQFLVAFVTGGIAARRGRWELIPLIAFAVRVNLDPQTFTYYMTGAVLGAYIWDVTSPTRLPGIRTALTWFALLGLPIAVHTISRSGLPPTFVVALRVSVLAAVLISMMRTPKPVREPANIPAVIPGASVYA